MYEKVMWLFFHLLLLFEAYLFPNHVLCIQRADLIFDLMEAEIYELLPENHLRFLR